MKRKYNHFYFILLSRAITANILCISYQALFQVCDCRLKKKTKTKIHYITYSLISCFKNAIILWIFFPFHIFFYYSAFNDYGVPLYERTIIYVTILLLWVFLWFPILPFDKSCHGEHPYVHPWWLPSDKLWIV